MTVLLFEYGHSKINTWNGHWTGEGKVFAKEVFLTFTHDFGDGWVAKITMTVGAKKDFEEIMKRSEGFLGYEWIIDSILKHGKIVEK